MTDACLEHDGLVNDSLLYRGVGQVGTSCRRAASRAIHHDLDLCFGVVIREGRTSSLNRGSSRTTSCRISSCSTKRPCSTAINVTHLAEALAEGRDRRCITLRRGVAEIAEGTYDRFAYTEAKSVALQRVADYIANVVSPNPSTNVVPLAKENPRHATGA
jgi:hypothetical protein